MPYAIVLAAENQQARPFSLQQYIPRRFIKKATDDVLGPSAPSQDSQAHIDATTGIHYHPRRGRHEVVLGRWHESGTPMTRTFCGQCGSTLFAFTPLRADIVLVAAGTLDDFESWTPDKEMWCIRRAAFLNTMKGVQKSDRHVMSLLSPAEELQSPE